MEIAFDKISYSVPLNVGCLPSTQKQVETKQILDEISGLVRPGELFAVMGPSGGGKTTLLDILSGRVGKFSGKISINGRPMPQDDFRKIAGYVPQDDVVMGTLTVFENLLFSADLRLPKFMSKQDKIARVHETIKLLGLEAVTDSKVGTQLIRGISGGERKRLSIGMELITAPAVLFLDEPTTGLDSTTAISVMRTLKSLVADGQRCIICSIHQPRFKIFDLFDGLMLLAHGRVVYNGAPAGCVPYFGRLGYICEPFNNPADFILDILSAQYVASSAASDAASAHSFVTSHSSPKHLTSTDDIQSAESDDKDLIAKEAKELANMEANVHCSDAKCSDCVQAPDVYLAAEYRKSDSYLKLRADIKASNLHHDHDQESVKKRKNILYKLWNSADEQRVNSWRQFMIVSRRAALNVARNPETSVMQLFVMVFFAAIVGLIYYRIDLTEVGIQNRAGALYFLVVNLVFSNLSAIELFLVERKIFTHERSNNYYRTGPYFLGKMMSDFLPLRLVPTFVFGCIVYWMVGLQASVGRFLTFLVITMVTSVCSAAVCFFASMVVNVFSVANLIVSLMFVFFMVFGGFLLNVATIPVYFRWLEYLSIFRYAIEALNVNEFSGLEFSCLKNATADLLASLPADQKLPQDFLDSLAANGTKPCVITGEQYLDAQGFKDDRLWFNIGLLGLMTCVYLGLSFWGLVNIGKRGR
eukprot:Partr_v1_DN27702_c0_g1_i1_m67543 putative ATP-binding cassette, subfamily G (WHITE), member 2